MAPGAPVYQKAPDEEEDSDATGTLPNNLRPFHSSPSEAIVLFNIYILRGLMSTFSLIVHRKSFLAHLPPLDDPSSPSSTETTHGEPRTGDDRRVVTPIPWANWGPPVSRWLRTERVPTRWITTSTGQRYVQIDNGAWNQPAPIVIYDFNPLHSCRRANSRRERLCGRGEEDGEDGDLGWYGGDLGPFDEEVYSELPYGLVASERLFNYDSVLMDEERIIGMHVRVFFFFFDV
jgi:hypothetical protein